MSAKDYRSRAWDKLRGKWGSFAVIMLIYSIIEGVLGGLSSFEENNAAFYFIVSLAAVITFIIAGPFEFGINKTALMVSDKERIQIETLFDGFKDFTRTVCLCFINSILVFLWSILLIIPGIIKALSYDMSYFILKENPKMSANDARIESMRIMEGNKWRLFCLKFSFIGWYLLSILTLGILLLWVVPYTKVACAEFYKDIKDGKGIADKKVEEE